MKSEQSNEPTQRQQTWLKHLRAWRAQGGGTLADYARANQLSLKALYMAKSKLERGGHWPERGAQSMFVPVRVASEPTVYRVVLPNAVIVEVPVDTDTGRCVALLRAAAAVS